MRIIRKKEILSGRDLSRPLAEPMLACVQDARLVQSFSAVRDKKYVVPTIDKFAGIG
jgi:hypothetical protein